MKEAKKMKCYRDSIQVSGLCGEPFLVVINEYSLVVTA